MKNEMLQYWEYVLELNETLVKTSEMHLKIFNKSIRLYNIFKDTEVKEMIGNIEMLENVRDETIQSISDTKKQVKWAKIQIKSYTALYNLSMKSIDESQSN